MICYDLDNIPVLIAFLSCPHQLSLTSTNVLYVFAVKKSISSGLDSNPDRVTFLRRGLILGPGFNKRDTGENSHRRFNEILKNVD